MSDSGTAANGTTANGTTANGTTANGTASNGTALSGIASNWTASNRNGTAANGSAAPNGQTTLTTKANLTSLAHLHATGQGDGTYRPENRRRGAISGPSAGYSDGIFDEEVGTGENEEG